MTVLEIVPTAIGQVAIGQVAIERVEIERVEIERAAIAPKLGVQAVLVAVTVADAVVVAVDVVSVAG
ncbi:hypothetical protein GCM10023156_16330 [Novipirellula rosea]|uniref:Uncharacterized protein n=1 Tax=Novipirellula rosea TaxID=1031540 RepID=A0ABP8MKH3_9BACT